MLKDKNHTPVFVLILHKWTPEEKQVTCACCLLAENMKDCKLCSFYTPAKIDPFLLFAKNYLANIPNGAKQSYRIIPRSLIDTVLTNER